jgi:hypothetical protein
MTSQPQVKSHEYHLITGQDDGSDVEESDTISVHSLPKPPPPIPPPPPPPFSKIGRRTSSLTSEDDARTVEWYVQRIDITPLLYFAHVCT